LSVQDEVEVIGVMDIACRLARPSAAWGQAVHGLTLRVTKSASSPCGAGIVCYQKQSAQKTTGPMCWFVGASGLKAL
jgi:hypothetical protein